MYIGQGLKDIIRWPRPSMPPVVQLEKKWALEYGMPSTHAMVGLAVPTAAALFTSTQYNLPLHIGLIIMSCWCTLVCCSRLYLGMHSIADILAGLLLSSLLLLWVIPFVHLADSFLVCSSFAPVVTVSLSILAIYYYPGSDRWTPARGDTTATIGCYLGVHIGSWCNYQMGLLTQDPNLPKYLILFPSLNEAVFMFLRVFIGAIVALTIRAVVKPLSSSIACLMLSIDAEKIKKQKYSIHNKEKLFVDLFTKVISKDPISKHNLTAPLL